MDTWTRTINEWVPHPHPSGPLDRLHRDVQHPDGPHTNVRRSGLRCARPARMDLSRGVASVSRGAEGVARSIGRRIGLIRSSVLVTGMTHHASLPKHLPSRVGDLAQVVGQGVEDQRQIGFAMEVVVGFEAAVGEDEDVLGLESLGDQGGGVGGRRGRGRGIRGRRSARGRRGRTGRARPSGGWHGRAGRRSPCPRP